MIKRIIIACNLLFSTLCANSAAIDKPITESGKIGKYTYVDLGLKSGTKWATCNVGASKPTDIGEYYAWGETAPKNKYKQENYKWSKDSCRTYSKYVARYEAGTVDTFSTLESADDAATVNWGAEWRMPTQKETKELIDGCKWEETDNFNNSGVRGIIGTSKTNGNIIFLPCVNNGKDNWDKSTRNYYWTSSIDEKEEELVFCIDFYRKIISSTDGYRTSGFLIRAVDNKNHEKPASTNKTITVSGKIDKHDYVDLGLPSKKKWATCNVGASKPSDYGNSFAWGETTPKKDYSWKDYKHIAESYKNLNEKKYNYDSDIKRGCNKYTIADQQKNAAWYNSKGEFIGDNLTTLRAEDDAATANWGKHWRMPTINEMTELINGCNWEWTDDFNGNTGWLGTSKVNGNTIFFPSAGDLYRTNRPHRGSEGHYWSSTLSIRFSNAASELVFSSDNNISDQPTDDREKGKSIRAISK